MTMDEAIAWIQRQLGFRRALASEIQTSLQQAIIRIELDATLSRPRFLVQEYSDAAFVTTAGTRTVAIPTGFLQEAELDGGLYIYDSTADDPYIELTKAEPAYVRGAFTESEQPTHYGIQGANLIFGGIPDAAYDLRWFAYFKDNAAITGSETNLWLTHRPFLIIGEAGVHIASAARSPSLDYFSQLLTAERKALEATVVVDEEADSSSSMGGDD